MAVARRGALLSLSPRGNVRNAILVDIIRSLSVTSGAGSRPLLDKR